MAAMDVVNLAAWQEQSKANGPGRRFVLWLQGCRRRCPGCINAEMQPLEKRHLVRIADLDAIIAHADGVEGVTYTGGEPFLQAAGLAGLSERLQHRGLSVMCYSGYTLHQLQEMNDTAVNRLLRLTDILVDGPFNKDLAACLRWRGSRNQQVHFLTKRYQGLADRVDTAPAQMELSIGHSQFAATGHWPDGFFEEVQRELRGGDPIENTEEK
jgi:anaerobic ribonucleoside-triphosphate reductase activating protein